MAALEPVNASRGTTWRMLTEVLGERPVGDFDFAAALEDVQRHQPDMPTTVRSS